MVLFGNKLNGDSRVPLEFFEFMGHQFGIVAPELDFWNQNFAIMMMQSLFASIVGALLYMFVLSSRKSASGILVVLGLILPAIATFPYFLNETLELENAYIKIVSPTLSMVTLLRLVESIYGFSPKAARTNITSFVLYYACPVECIWDESSLRHASRKEKLNGLRDFLLGYLQLSIFLSVLNLYSEFPFYRVIDDSNSGRVPIQYFRKEQLLSNFLLACFFQFALMVCGGGLTVAVELTLGWKTIDVMKNPLFEATSPRDFWSRRWNQNVHGALKRGCFKPVYSHVSHFNSHGKIIACLATFLTSGLLHEWIMHVVYHQTSLDPSYGFTTSFFLWNGMLVCLESMLSELDIFSAVRKVMPRQMTTVMVLSTAIPVAHWFSHDYDRVDFFRHFQVGFPLIVKM